MCNPKNVTIITVNVVGVSLITGLECETVEWKLKWNGESTQLQLTCVTGTAQSRLNYLVYL